MSFGEIIERVVIGTSQGKLATAGYGILFVSVLIATLYNNQKHQPPSKTSSKKLSVWELLLIFVLLALSYVLSIYSINCMVLGNDAGIGCGAWAWVNAVVVLVFALAIVLTAFFTGHWAPLSVN